MIRLFPLPFPLPFLCPLKKPCSDGCPVTLVRVADNVIHAWGWDTLYKVWIGVGTVVEPEGVHTVQEMEDIMKLYM
ncbi:MAG: hypothetical protein J5792_07900 [Bacteroidales bacterium]|nr:hypothetical protein [Bacteroidales bacterium]